MPNHRFRATTPSSGTFDHFATDLVGAPLDSVAPADRVAFFRRTYGLVAASFLGFAGLLAVMFAGFDEARGIGFAIVKGLGGMMQSLGSWSVILVMVAFWGGSAVAQRMAHSETSRGRQYAGLSLYVLLQALLFVPLIGMASLMTHGNASTILLPASIVTGALIVGLTATVFLTDLDFSILRAVVVIGSIAAVGVAVVAAIADHSLGIWFSIVMILLMSTTILYQTDVIRKTFGTGQHVPAAFLLFSSFVTLFFYVVRFFMQREE
jgi:FtsH-binding integral membrane protein